MIIESMKHKVGDLLGAADVRLNGNRPWDIQVHSDAFYPRIVTRGSLGLGETFMDGLWDALSLDDFIAHLLHAHLDTRVRTSVDRIAAVLAQAFNLQKGWRAFEVGRRHYDLGNDLYRAMLGRYLVYSCGYWRDAGDLDAAQEAKLDLICRKLQLRPGMHVLDIGCGWGEALRWAAQRYGVSGVGITISEEQVALARERCEGLALQIRLQDYRDLDEPFDRIFSVGMFEHVGVKNYRRYFEVARRCLRPDGLFLLHCIGTNVSTVHTDPWIAKYIFPNSMLPSATQIAAALEGLFVIEDWHNFGADYEKTLLAWRDNVEQAWASLGERYDERFRRMWHYYLSASIALFRERQGQLWQIVLSPEGVKGGYRSLR